MTEASDSAVLLRKAKSGDREALNALWSDCDRTFG